MKINNVFKLILAASVALVVFIFFMYRANNWPGGLSAQACLLSLLALIIVFVLLSLKHTKWLNQLQKDNTTAGLFFGLLWTAEISMNNIIQPGLPLRDWLDDIFWALVAVLIFASAVRAALRSGKVRAGVQAGFWSGLASGLTACITALLLIVAGMRFITTDPLNQREWSDLVTGSDKKGLYTHDMAVYFAYQSLAGAMMHLIVLGGVMGLLLGLVGGFIGKLAKRFTAGKKLTFLLCLGLSSINVFCQHNSPGYWSGTMDREGRLMKISIELKTLKGATTGFYNAATQRASGIPLDSVTVAGDSVKFQLMSEPVTYFSCRVTGNKITGEFTQEGFTKGVVSLAHSARPVVPYTFLDTSFSSSSHRIACRIYFPAGKGPFPALVFLHGSGGEGMLANQYLAEYLASKGIVTLIQDKQGVGKSTGDWTKASFDALADDYAQSVDLLKVFGKVNKHQIGIYGHSQGATLSPLVASRSKSVSFIIAAAAIGDSVYKQDLYRVENNLKANGFTSTEIKEAMQYYSQWLDMARTGTKFDNLDSLNKASKDKKWFEWVEAPPREHWIWAYYLQTGNYNSLDYWPKVCVPVMLVYGENDQIENVPYYLQSIDSAVHQAGHVTDITELILPKAQHNLCVVPGKDEKFFWWYLSRGYEDLIAGWVKYRFKD